MPSPVALLKGSLRLATSCSVRKSERSKFRHNVEDTVSLRAGQSMVDGFTAGIEQFAVAMIGLGKLGIAKAAVTEIAKAATVGAVAFDPHEERLSDLI